MKHGLPATVVLVTLFVTVAGCRKAPTPPEPSSGPPTPASPARPVVQAGTPAAHAKVFEERIAPIFKSPDPSSCARCHLAAVDLKDYILPSATDTFLALRDQGLIDLDKPEASKILRLISRGADGAKAAGLIPAGQQRAEYDAFAAWIKACAADPTLRGAPKPATAPVLATRPAEVVRYARRDRMAESFASNVWALRFRCMNCHTEGTPQNDKLVKEHGDRVAWFKKDGPAATMDYLLASKLIDWAAPGKSLLLTKPLGEVKHGGGVKFVVGDQGYKAFRAWIEDAAAIKGGRYTKPEDLPPPATGPKQFGTEVWLKLENLPEGWAGRLLQADVYARDARTGGWEAEPLATSDRAVGGKGVWQHTLTLLAAPGSEREKVWAAGKPALPAGKYLVKVYVDPSGRPRADWKAAFGPAEYVGEIEVQGRWAEGYGTMTAVDAGRFKK